MTLDQQVSSPLDVFRALPKVELHRHLEGSLRLDTMCEIARNHQLDLPHDDVVAFRKLVQMAPGEAHTFQNFLGKFNTLRMLYQSPEVIQRITREAIEDAAADNIRYMELRFTPVALTRAKGFSLRDAVTWVCAAANEAAALSGMTVRLIVSTNRHESVALADEAFQVAADFMPQGVVGVDLAGDEANHAGEGFGPVFTSAAQAGLHVTIHAGEWGPASRIRLALDTLGAERIGHGVRVIDDEALIAECRERGIVFEVCPTSNIHSGNTAAMRQHPLHEMHKAGLRVTLNTDDPGISLITLSAEYFVVSGVLNFDLDELRRMTLNAAGAAFLPEAEKQDLVSVIDKEFHPPSQDKR